MGNYIGLINHEQLNGEAHELDRLYLQLGSNIGRKGESFYINELMKFFVQNNYNLSSDTIKQWWTEREKLFLSVDELLWSNPIMFDDLLCNFGIEEMKSLTMTSNIKNRIHKYLEKLSCIISDEFSVMGNFNWEEYIGIRLQCYINLIITLGKLHLKFLNSNEDNYLKTNRFITNNDIFGEEMLLSIRKTFDDNFGNLKIYEKLYEKFFKQKSPKENRKEKFNSKLKKEISNNIIGYIQIPGSLDKIYKKRVSSDPEITLFIKFILGYIWSYYKAVILSNEPIYNEIFHKIDKLFPIETKNVHIDKNTMLSLIEILQSLFLNIVFNSLISEFNEKACLLEHFIEIILEFGNNILSLVCGNEKKANDYSVFENKVLNPNLQNKNLLLIIFECMFSEDDFFFKIIKTCLIVISILTTGVNRFLEKYSQNNTKTIGNLNKNVNNQGENFQWGKYYSNDVFIITMVMRIINKCINLMQQLWKFNNLLSNEVNYLDSSHSIREEQFCYGPMKFYSAPKNTFILEFHEKSRHVDVFDNLRNQLIEGIEIEILEDYKYYWKLISVHNASHLIIIFDNNCITEKNIDVLEIFGSNKNCKTNKNNQDFSYLKSQYTESLFGKLSGYKYTWPKKPYIYEGNTLLVVFRTSLEPLNQIDDWGFRIYFQCHYWNYEIETKTNQDKSDNQVKFQQRDISMFILKEVFIFAVVAVVSSLSFMLRGPNISEIENSFIEILDSLLFAGGLAIEHNEYNQDCSNILSNLKKSVTTLLNVKNNPTSYTSFNAQSKKLIDLKDRIINCKLSGGMIQNMKVKSDIFYICLPRIDDIEDQIINNLHWGQIVNFILNFSSIIHYNAKKNHLNLTIELIKDKKFMNFVRNDLITANIGDKKLSVVMRGYICCYLHHLGLYYNIFQLCENLIYSSLDLVKIIKLILETYSENNFEYIHNKTLFEFTINFVLQQEFCQPILYIWTIGRKFRTWIFMKKHESKTHQSNENKLNESNKKLEFNFDFLLNSTIDKISIILSLLPFSGNKHPNICLKNNLSEYKEIFCTRCSEEICNHFDISGSKYIFYSNKNICFVLESIIGFDKYKKFFDKYQEEMSDSSINSENFKESAKNINLSIIGDSEFEKLNFDRVIKDICDGIENFIKSMDHLINSHINENEGNFILFNIVLSIRRLRAISRFEAFRVLKSLISDENNNEFFLSTLMKSIRSMGRQTPYLFPINNNENELLELFMTNHFYLPNEYYNKNKISHNLETHYFENLVGCGKQIQKQVKDAFYILLQSLINGVKTSPIRTEILKMSVFAYFSFKKMDGNDFLKTNFPSKILNLLTGCSKNCELGNECVPSVSLGPYPMFLLYSIICLKFSLQENSKTKLSLIFSSFVGLSHSISISGEFKGRLTTKELWRICEIYFMGNILILTSKMNNFLNYVEISRTEQKKILENMKYIFNRRNCVNSLVKFCDLDDLFIKIFYIQPSVLTNIIRRALNSSNQVLHFLCIKFLWKFLPLTSIEDFLQYYSDGLIPTQNILKTKIARKSNFIDYFEGYLEKIGKSVILFESFEKDESKIHPPALSIISSEIGPVNLFESKEYIFDNTNRLINNDDDFYKSLILLLRFIVLHSEKSEKMENKISLKNRNPELVHNRLIEILCEQLYKIPPLLNSLLNFCEDINLREVHICIGTLAIIIDEYDCETYIGKLVYFQENQPIGQINKTWELGVLISNNPLKKEYSILTNDFKSIEIKKFSYNSINFLDKNNISFPIKFMITKLNCDTLKVLTTTLKIAFEYLSKLSSNIGQLEKYISISIMDNSATISSFEKKKLIGLQFISMSMSFINILFNNDYISTLNSNNGRYIDQLVELFNIIMKIGMINLPSINEKANGLSNIISVILSRRFIQRTLRKDQFAISSYYPIFKKYTQADLLDNSPYSNIILKLPTKWEFKNQCFYFNNESTIIINLNYNLLQKTGKSVMITANRSIPTSLCFYYFEINFSFSNKLPTHTQLKANSSFINGLGCPFIISVGFYRDGCQKGSSGSFGSYAFKNTGKLIHGCDESEFSEVEVENFNDGDTVGCGIDFLNKIAFFTKNGKIVCKKLGNHTFVKDYILKNDYSIFENVMGHFKPAVWIEQLNYKFDISKYLIINANFGQEMFKYEYINKLSYENILSIQDENSSIFRDSLGKFTIKNLDVFNFNELNEAEMNRLTMAFELHEIIGGSSQIPLTVCIHALENCQDNLDLAANSLLEHLFDDSSLTQKQNQIENYPKSVKSGIKTCTYETKYINNKINSEKENLFERLISLENNKYESCKYFELITNLILKKYHGEFYLNKDLNFDIPRYLLFFGSFGEKNYPNTENHNLNNDSNSEIIRSYFSSDIWFNSQNNFQGYERKTSLIEDLRNRISSLSFQHFSKDQSFTEATSNFKKRQISFFPGTIVCIAPNIKYWMIGFQKNECYNPENDLLKCLGNIIDLINQPKIRIIYYLRILSKLTGIVWQYNQVANSTLVQFFDYNSLVYYLVNLPSNFLVGTDTNIKPSNYWLTNISGINVQTMQEYIESVFLSEICNISGKTFFYSKLPQVFRSYLKSEFFKCIKLTRDAISKNLNQFQKCLTNLSNDKRSHTTLSILKMLKLYFGSKGPKISDYFVPMYSIKGIFSIYYTSLFNEEYMSDYIRFLEEVSEEKATQFTDMVLKEYISTIKAGVYSEIPIIKIETNHPYECMTDKRYDISSQDCDYFFAIFDPLCEINFDNLSFLTITFNSCLDGRTINLFKKSGKGLSGFKIVIPTNSFTVHLVTSSQNNNKYGIKAYFIPLKYSLSDSKILENKNIHFSYLLLDLIFKNKGNSLDVMHIREVVEVLLSIIFELNISSHIYKRKLGSKNHEPSFIPTNEEVIPIQNSFIHIVQQLINIFIKHPEVTYNISQNSIIILDYLNMFSNIIYSLQMDQLQIVTNHGRNVNIKYCIALQLHYLLFFYKNFEVNFTDNWRYPQELCFTGQVNIPYSKLSLELQIQHNLIAELNLAFHNSSIKYYYKNNSYISHVQNKVNPIKNHNESNKVSISAFFLNGDMKTHNLLVSEKKSFPNFCKWYNIISTTNISIPTFISSINYIYSEKYGAKNNDLSNEDSNNKVGHSSQSNELNEIKNYSCFYEPDTPLVLIEKLGEIQISISNAMIIIPFDPINSSNTNLSIDITQFIRENLEFMDDKLLLLPKNRLLWLSNQTLKNQLSHYDEPSNILNNPIIINYSLRRVLTDELIVSRNINYNNSDLVILTASTLDDSQDRVKLLWDLLTHLNNKDSTKMTPRNINNWMECWEDELISSKMKGKDDCFDPRNFSEYLNIYKFPTILNKNKANSRKKSYNGMNYNSLLESSAIQLMREFLVKSYSEGIFQRKYWPVFVGTIPICDFKIAGNSSNMSDECEEPSECKLICDSPSNVSNFREMNAPCSISFWLFPINHEQFHHTFSISNNKKFKIYTNRLNLDHEERKFSGTKISKYLNTNEKWKLIAYRGVTVSTISFWITELGNLAVIVNSPNKNYPLNLINNNQVTETESFSSFIQNKSSAIEFQTTIIISNRKINFDQWNHIVATVGFTKKTENYSTYKTGDCYTIRLYLNGLLDECKIIPAGNLPLIGGDLPWIIGYPKYLRADSFHNNSVIQSTVKDPLINETANIFLGQDFGSSKLLNYLGQNRKYINLLTGEPLFGLLANFIVIHFEWEMENIHDYIKNTFDEILFQDELDEINNSEKLLNNNLNSKNQKINSFSEYRNSYKYSKSILHVFSNNWKYKPIVSHFNNIWQHEYINKKIDPDKEIKTKESNDAGILNICGPKIIIHDYMNRRKTHTKLDFTALEQFEINGNEEESKKSNRSVETNISDCSCIESPIDTIFVVGENIEESVFIIRLKYLNKIFNDLTLNKLKKELDILFEKEVKTSKNDPYSNSVSSNLDILHDTFSNHEIIKKFESYCNFNGKNPTNKFLNKAKNSKYLEIKENIESKKLKYIQNVEISNEENQEIIASVSNYINFLFNEIKFTEPIFAIPKNTSLALYTEKIGCNKCKITVFNYLNICNTIIKRISILFVSVFNFINIISPRPSFFKYSWLKMVRKYLSLSIKEVLINLCLSITEDPKADGKIRVTIDRAKSIFVKKEAQYLDQKLILTSVFGQLYNFLENVPIYRLRCKKRPWYVIYDGEGGIDAGGIYRDLLSHICLELQSDKLPLFVVCPNSYNYGESQFFFVPNPSLGKKVVLNDQIKIEKNINDSLKDKIKYEGDSKFLNSTGCIKLIYDSLYTFIGRLMGISIRTQIPLNLDLPTIIWKLILGDNISLEDLKQIDYYSVKFYEKLKQIEYIWENTNNEDECKKNLLQEFCSLELNWTCLNINSEVVELKSGGERLPVRIQELGKYCGIFKEYKLEREFLHATNNIRKGITEIIPENILELLTCEELENLVCGNPSIDVNLLKQHTKYSGYSSDDKIINWFWDVVSEMSALQQQMFLRFVWGRSRLPRSGAQWECNMEIVRVYTCEDSIQGGETDTFESREVLDSIVPEYISRISSNLSLNNQEINTEFEGESNNDEPSTEQINQEYLNEQLAMNITSTNMDLCRNKADDLLPTSHTCFFQLELPMYSSKLVLKEKLLYAITECVAIDMDNLTSNNN